MTRRAKNLDERAEIVRVRQEKKRAREAARIERRTAKLEARVARLKERQKEERQAWRTEVEQLSVQAGITDEPRRISVVRPEIRERICTFRAERAWPVRVMARYCLCTGRDIKRIESPDLTVEMLEQTVRRIVNRMDASAPPTPAEREAWKARTAGRPVLKLKVVPQFKEFPESGPVTVGPTEKYLWPGPAMRQTIRDFRKRHGWSMKQMARECGVHKGLIERLDGAVTPIYAYTSVMERIFVRIGIGRIEIAYPAPLSIIDRPDLLGGKPMFPETEKKQIETEANAQDPESEWVDF
jgi:hypothetical protein